MTYYVDDYEYIYVNNNSISPVVCNYLINLFEHDASHLVYPGRVGCGALLPDIKKSLDLKLNPRINKYDSYMFKELAVNIDKYFYNMCTKYQSKLDVIVPIKNSKDTGYNIQKYTANTGVYKYHNDSTYNKTENGVDTRVLAFIWYLNTVDEGGETEFFNGRIKVKPEQGKLLIFPATWTYMHSGKIPTSGDKYIVTGWIYGDIPIY